MCPCSKKLQFLLQPRAAAGRRSCVAPSVLQFLQLRSGSEVERSRSDGELLQEQRLLLNITCSTCSRGGRSRESTHTTAGSGLQLQQVSARACCVVATIRTSSSGCVRVTSSSLFTPTATHLIGKQWLLVSHTGVKNLGKVTKLRI